MYNPKVSKTIASLAYKDRYPISLHHDSIWLNFEYENMFFFSCGSKKIIRDISKIKTPKICRGFEKNISNIFLQIDSIPMV